MKAKKAKPRLPKAKREYVVYLAFRRDHFKKLSADKQVTLFGIADHVSPPHTENLSLTFKRAKWFHACGEVYALLVGNVPFTLCACSVPVMKGRAK